MINTVADFLQALKKKEEEIVDNFQEDKIPLEHPTIIGEIYEGITENLLNKALFKGLDLKIVSGQIKNKSKEKSAEVDIMIVEGKGIRIPNTNRWIYDISQVIAVVAVKKNLYKKDLIDSYNKMERITKIFDPKDMHEGEYRLFRDSFRAALRMDVPDHNEIHKYDLVTELMYHSLLMEAVMPLRVVFGFYGYKNMMNLRNSFTDFIINNLTEDPNKPIKGFGPTSFPNLIITRDNSLIKLNGIPYQANIDSNNFWNVYASSSQNPLLHFLEMLWTKLSYKHRIPPQQIFGEDLEIEGLLRYMLCKPIESEGNIGWEYRVIDLPKDFDGEPRFIQWEPEELNEVEHYLMVLLCNGEIINTEDELFVNLFKRHNLCADKFIEKLNIKKLVFKDKDNNLQLLTDECLVGIINGKYYAGENKNGKMDRWLSVTLKNR